MNVFQFLCVLVFFYISLSLSAIYYHVLFYFTVISAPGRRYDLFLSLRLTGIAILRSYSLDDGNGSRGKFADSVSQSKTLWNKTDISAEVYALLEWF